MRRAEEAAGAPLRFLMNWFTRVARKRVGMV
jgi:hypothetical protein